MGVSRDEFSEVDNVMKLLLVGDLHIGFLSSSFLRGFGRQVHLSLIKERLNLYDMILNSDVDEVVFMGDLLHQGLYTEFSTYEILEIWKLKEIMEKKKVIVLEGHHDKKEDFEDLSLFPYFDDFMILENPKRIFFNARRDLKKRKEVLKSLKTNSKVLLFFHEDFDVFYKMRGVKNIPSEVLELDEVKSLFPNSVIFCGHFHNQFSIVEKDFYAVGSLTPISFNEALRENDDFIWTGMMEVEISKGFVYVKRIYYEPFLFLKIADYRNLNSLLEKIEGYSSPLFCEFINPPEENKAFARLKTLITGYRTKKEMEEEELDLVGQSEISDGFKKEDLVKLIREKLEGILSDKEIEEIIKEVGI